MPFILTDTWKTVGSSFAVIVSLATGAFIYFNVAQAETEGMFWVWFIHFLQDVIIFGGLFLAVG